MKKSSSSKSSGKSSTPKIVVDSQNTATIKKIENGYIISESGYTGKGRNQQWFNREYFSPTNPVSGVDKTIKFGKK
jgi:hypothetical protein